MNQSVCGSSAEGKFMKLMVVGGGGREHAIIKKLKESSAVEMIYALPGNGGIAADAVCVDIGAKDIEGMVAFAKEKKIDFQRCLSNQKSREKELDSEEFHYFCKKVKHFQEPFVYKV